MLRLLFVRQHFCVMVLLIEMRSQLRDSLRVIEMLALELDSPMQLLFFFFLFLPPTPGTPPREYPEYPYPPSRCAPGKVLGEYLCRSNIP